MFILCMMYFLLIYFKVICSTYSANTLYTPIYLENIHNSSDKQICLSLHYLCIIVCIFLYIFMYIFDALVQLVKKISRIHIMS